MTVATVLDANRFDVDDVFDGFGDAEVSADRLDYLAAAIQTHNYTVEPDAVADSMLRALGWG